MALQQSLDQLLLMDEADVFGVGIKKHETNVFTNHSS